MSVAIQKVVHNKRDDMYTPRVLAESIIPFVISYYYNIEDNIQFTIWCPFDSADSEIVKALEAWRAEVEEWNDNITIIHSHIDNGQDFFQIEPPECDVIISNPPFSRKLDVFKRLEELNIPYAMLMNVMALNYNVINNFFYENNNEKTKGFIIVDKKVSFDGRCSAFNTSWICDNFLEEPLEFVRIEHNNQGKNFEPSKMLCAKCKRCNGELKGLECMAERGIL